MLRFGESRKFDDSPFVQEMVKGIASAEPVLHVFKDGYFVGNLTTAPGKVKLHVSIFVSKQKLAEGRASKLGRVVGSITSNEKVNAFAAASVMLMRTGTGVEPGGNPPSRGIDVGMAKLYYGMMNGIAAYADQHPEVSEVVIDAGRVVNPRLRKTLKEMGFSNPHEGQGGGLKQSFMELRISLKP